jgi:PTH2 family peptidyl-tRNA hydrolase
MKQAIIIRTDLKMGKGKISVEVAHASLMSLKLADKKKAAAWEAGGQKKVVLKVGSLDELRSIYKKASIARLPCSMVMDAGLTQVKTGSETAVGIGPDEDSKIDGVTRHLKLL